MADAVRLLLQLYIGLSLSYSFTALQEGRMAAFGYVRVSTDRQAEEGESLGAQERTIQGYAMMHGLKLDRVFVERAVSGSRPIAERPEGAKLMAAATAADVVITPKLDRMFRSALDALDVLARLKERGVSLHIIDLGGDVTGNGISKLVFTILSAVAEAERDRIRERIRDLKRHLASQGVYGGGKRPFGFDVVGEGKAKRLVPNVEEQAVVARMRTLRDQGQSFHR